MIDLSNKPFVNTLIYYKLLINLERIVILYILLGGYVLFKKIIVNVDLSRR